VPVRLIEYKPEGIWLGSVAWDDLPADAQTGAQKLGHRSGGRVLVELLRDGKIRLVPAARAQK